VIVRRIAGLLWWRCDGACCRHGGGSGILAAATSGKRSAEQITTWASKKVTINVFIVFSWSGFAVN
jgi:hypothetical protein